jgi:NitT/TauT family transport system ATP-binding protein
MKNFLIGTIDICSAEEVCIEAEKNMIKSGDYGLELINIDKRYSELKVLDQFCLQLPAAGVVGLSGPSGCGKTTLLKLLGGLEKPDHGEIHGQSDKKISMVFQEDRLLPWLTVIGNLYVVQTDPSVIRYYLESMKLTAQAHSYPDSLSGGMQRRTALARALCYGGSVFLLDEPFKGLDLDLRQEISQHIEDLAKNSLVIIVSHDEGDLSNLADQIIYLSGPPLTVVNQRENKKRESQT